MTRGYKNICYSLFGIFCMACVLLTHAQDGFAEGQKPFRVALLLEHEEDSAWNNLLSSGLKKAAEWKNIETQIVYAPVTSDQREVFKKVASNSDLVLVATDNMHEILRDNAANFRRVMFGCIDAGVRAPNIMSVTFADEQAAFLAGAAAAMMTVRDGVPGINRSNTIAWLSGEDTPAMRSLFNGYSEGAKLIDPGIRVMQAVVGSFVDPKTAAKKAAWLKQNEADVVTLAAGFGNKAAQDSLGDAWHIGLDKLEANQHSAGAITKAADRAVLEIVKAAANGSFRGKEIIIYDLENGGVDFTGVDNFIASDRNAKDIKRRLGELRHELKNGAIRLHSFRARTLCDCLD